MPFKRSITAFIQKVWNILESGENALLSWKQDGLSFCLHHQTPMSRDILSKNFKHSNYTSFVRQLNMYSFRKIRTNKVQQEFSHQLFRKGKRQLLEVLRRTPTQADIAEGQRLLKSLSLDSHKYTHLVATKLSPTIPKKMNSRLRLEETQGLGQVALFQVQQNRQCQTLSNVLQQLQPQRPYINPICNRFLYPMQQPMQSSVSMFLNHLRSHPIAITLEEYYGILTPQTCFPSVLLVSPMVVYSNSFMNMNLA